MKQFVPEVPRRLKWWMCDMSEAGPLQPTASVTLPDGRIIHYHIGVQDDPELHPPEGYSYKEPNTPCGVYISPDDCEDQKSFDQFEEEQFDGTLAECKAWAEGHYAAILNTTHDLQNHTRT